MFFSVEIPRHGGFKVHKSGCLCNRGGLILADSVTAYRSRPDTIAVSGECDLRQAYMMEDAGLTVLVLAAGGYRRLN